MPVNDFNQIKFAEAELFLNVQTDGTITGTLSFPAQSAQAEKLFMDITVGSVKILQDQFNFEFTAQGRKNTEIFDYLYNYYGSVTHTWENGINQRLSLAGTDLRDQDPNNPRKYVYVWYILDDESKNKIRDLGWYLERPPFTNPNQPTERG